MAKVTIKKRANKALQRLDKATRARVLEALAKLAEDPNRRDLDITKLKLGGYRLRIGRWRVLFDRDRDTITVQDVRDRRDSYR